MSLSLWASADGYLHHLVFLVFEDSVGFLNLVERKTVCDERCGVNLSLLYKAKHFFAVAPVYASSLKRKVFAVHVGQW